LEKTVSIIIPCRNEELYIEKCVRSLLASNYPKSLITIYVCDGLSDDKTVEIVQKIAAEETCVKLLINENQTTPFALNLGLKTSNAAIKIILGAHSEVDPDFIKENIKAFEHDPQIGCTGGVLENVYEDENSKIIGLGMSSSFGVGNAHFRTGEKAGFVDTVAFGAYKKEVFETIGYFDESLIRNQDDEFNYRLIKNGFKIYLSPKIKCKYYVRGTFNKLYRQYFQYGYWKVFVNKKHKSITTIRQLVPLFFVLFLILGFLLSFVSPLVLTAYLLILVLYFFMAFLAAKKLIDKPRYWLKIIYVFFILHFSYGLGYLKGIWHFLFLNKMPESKQSRMSR